MKPVLLPDKSVIKVVEEVLSIHNLEKLQPKTAQEAAVIVFLSCAIGEFKIAQKHLALGATDLVLGASCLNFYASYTQNYNVSQQALQQLKRAFPLSSTALETVLEPRRENYYCGQEGSPLKFEQGNFYSLDASIYKLLAFDTIARVGARLGDRDSIGYAVAYDTLAKDINSILFDTGTGIYKNRTIDGRWSSYYGLTSLLPLVAGVTSDPERLWSTLRLVSDKKKFLSPNGLTSMPADGYWYGKSFVDFNGHVAKKYESFSGMISPVLSFLVYLGLVRSGADDLSALVADRMATVFYKEWSEGGILPSYYLPSGKTSCENANDLTALLMIVAKLVEYSGPEPFSEKPSLHFGLKEGSFQASSIYWGGEEKLLVTSDSKQLSVSGGGSEVFFLKGANATIRNYYEDNSGVYFIIDCSDNCHLELNYPMLKPAVKRNCFVTLLPGKSIVKIDATENKAFVMRFNG